jgi:hypothetical protein
MSSSVADVRTHLSLLSASEQLAMTAVIKPIMVRILSRLTMD